MVRRSKSTNRNRASTDPSLEGGHGGRPRLRETRRENVMPTLLYVVAVVAVAILAFSLYRKLTRDHIDEINKGRRGSARIVGRGEYVDGNRHLEVALALSDTTFFYENPDMQASLDLEWIREVEYDDELSTGAAVENGSVLRLRTDSQSFEFV